MEIVGQCALCGENLTSGHKCPTFRPSDDIRWVKPLDLPGKKYDQGKLRMDLFPPKAMVELAKVLTHGASEYGDNNWQQVETKRYIAALFRHMFKWLMGESHDDKSKLHHLSHVLCNAAFIVHKKVWYKDKGEWEIYDRDNGDV